MQSPLALTAVGVVVTALIAVLTVVTDGLSRWERALVMALAVPVGVGVVWILRFVPKLRTTGRRCTAAIGLRAVESAFAYVNPPVKPARVVGIEDTAALVVPVDSRMTIGAAFEVYGGAGEVVGVVEVRRIEREEAYLLVVSRDSNEVWNNLEARMDKDDSPPDLQVRLANRESALRSAVDALQAWRSSDG